MPYGDFVGPIQYDPPAAQPAAPTAETAPASTAAGGQFGLYTLISLGVGFVHPAAWAGTVVLGICWLVAGAVVAPMEASAKQKAQAGQGGGGDILVIGVILAVLAVCGFLAMLGLAGGAR